MINKAFDLKTHTGKDGSVNFLLPILGLSGIAALPHATCYMQLPQRRNDAGSFLKNAGSSL